MRSCHSGVCHAARAQSRLPHQTLQPSGPGRAGPRGGTARLRGGVGGIKLPPGTPAMTAMTAATMSLVTGGRFRLGLGISGPQVSEGLHGVPFRRPLARTREYVEIVRTALARDGALEYEGEE